MTTGCGCKEVYRFSHTTYPYSSCICSFLSSIPAFFYFFLFFIKLLNPQYNYILDVCNIKLLNRLYYILDVCNNKLLNPQYIY